MICLWAWTAVRHRANHLEVLRGGYERRRAPSTAMVHQDVLARAPTDRTSERGPQGIVASSPR